MHIQDLVKFYPFVLKILSRNEIMMDGQMDLWNDRSSTAPLFQSRAINITLFFWQIPNIFHLVEKILAFSLVLRTRKKSDFFIALDEIYFVFA